MNSLFCPMKSLFAQVHSGLLILSMLVQVCAMNRIPSPNSGRNGEMMTQTLQQYAGPPGEILWRAKVALWNVLLRRNRLDTHSGRLTRLSPLNTYFCYQNKQGYSMASYTCMLRNPCRGGKIKMLNKQSTHLSGNHLPGPKPHLLYYCNRELKEGIQYIFTVCTFSKETLS